MLQQGLIEVSTSKCAQNILIIKKEGKEPQICIDPRAINKITALDPFPMPRMDQIFAGLYGSQVFTGLDAASGFWQIPIAQRHRHKAAFRCEFGVFQFKVMPFGLNNAPATFTRWMAETFQGLNDYLKVYIDDLLLHSQKVADHPRHLEEVFLRCEKQNVKLRLTKCSFMQEELPMLGFVINSQGVKKDMKKLEAIIQWGEGRPKWQFSPFKNLTQLQSFLGMVNFYKHHHRMIAEALVPLYDLLKKDKSPLKDWTTEHELAFQKIKHSIAEQCLLYFPDETLAFELHTDASLYAIGATLIQLRKLVQLIEGLDPEEKHPHVVEFFSRALKGAELNYTVTEKEFLAVVCSIERWHYYLHKPFLVVTDHKPLLGLTHTEKPRLKRWMLRITPFKFDIEHRAGTSMTDVDPLSRDPRLFRIAMEGEEKAAANPISGKIFSKYEALYVSRTVEIYMSPQVQEEVRCLSVRLHPGEIEETVRRILMEEMETESDSEEESFPPVSQSLSLLHKQEGRTERITLRVATNEPSVEESEMKVRLLPQVPVATKSEEELKAELEELTHLDQQNQTWLDHKRKLEEEDQPSPQNISSDSKTEIHPGGTQSLAAIQESELDEEKEEDSDPEAEDLPSYLKKILSTIRNMDPVIYPGSKTFADEQREDPLLAALIKELEQGGRSPQYRLEKDSGLLLRISEEGTCPKVVVPSQAVNTLLYLYHDHPLAGHAKARKMHEALKKRYYFPSMLKTIEQWVDQCKCKRASATLHQRAGLTLSRPIPLLFEVLVMDIVGPFPRSPSQNEYWLTLVDALSKDVELVPLRDRTAIQVAKAIMEKWVCRRGCPRVLISDNAKEFVGEVAKHLCEILQVRHDLITPYHHKGTTLVERVHSYAESILRALMEEKTTNGCWDAMLPYIQFAITTHSVDDSTVSPFEIKHGLPATLPGDLLVNSIALPKKLRKYYANAKQAMDATREYFSIQRKKKRVQTALQRNLREKRIKKFFEPGQAVYVSRPSFARVEGVKGLLKLQGKERGPYAVISRDSHNNVWVDIDGTPTKFSLCLCRSKCQIKAVERMLTLRL